jgi:hypothetical protein
MATCFLYKLSKLQLSVSLIKLINSYQSHRKSIVSVEGELSTPRQIDAGVPQGSVLAPTLYSLYINDTSQTSRVQLALFADDTCMYATEGKEGYVLKKLQHCLTAMEAWCEQWNIKIHEDKAQVICFSRRRGPVEPHLTFKGRNVPFVKDLVSRCNF